MQVEGVMCSLMQGLGETYLGAYALAMGLGQVSAGLVTTIPLMGGSVLQLVSPRAVSWLRSHRRWVVLCVGLQASCFLPLAFGSVAPSMPTPLIFAIVAVYWGTGLASGPAWSTWASSIVPVRMRPKFFGMRTRLSQGALLLGFLISGVTLQVAASMSLVREAFLALFSLAALSRFASGSLLAAQPEQPGRADRTRLVPWREMLARAVRSGEGRLLVYLVAMQGAVQLSGPYFTPFMLKQLQLSYGMYVLLVGTTYVAKMLAAPWWGRVAQRYGARRLLWIGGVGIVPVASLWLVSRSYPYLMCAMLLLLFDSLKEEERISVLTVYNLAASMATACGSLLGGLLLTLLGQSYEAYLALFGLSSAVRATTLLMLMRVVRQRGELDALDMEATGAEASDVQQAIAAEQWSSPVRVLRIDAAENRAAAGAVPAPHLALEHGDTSPDTSLCDADCLSGEFTAEPATRRLAAPFAPLPSSERLSA
jgi:MFS family permease